MKNKKIDIIIPAYNVEDKILFKCLSSIACQDISEDLKITIVDDGSTIQNYKKIAKFFKPFLDIQVLRYEENKGPGVARQYAIDRTNNEYIVFIDADDTFAGAYSLHILRTSLEEEGENCVLCVSDFEEYLIENELVYIRNYSNTLTGIAGKIYRRDFLEKNNIRFLSTKSCEDSGFNNLIKLYTQNEKQIKNIPTVVYHYHYNPESVTRKDIQNGWYYKQSFQDFIANSINFMKIAKKNQNKINQKHCYEMLSRNICQLYTFYLRCLINCPETNEKNLILCKEYYKFFNYFEKNISNELMVESYQNTLIQAQREQNFNFIPPFSFYEFLQMIKED